MEQRKDIPAFPSISEWQADSRGQAANTGHRVTKATEGMTLRDYFAAKALPALIEKLDFRRAWRAELPSDMALSIEAAYLIADAMLKAREK